MIQVVAFFVYSKLWENLRICVPNCTFIANIYMGHERNGDLSFGMSSGMSSDVSSGMSSDVSSGMCTDVSSGISSGISPLFLPPHIL